MFFILCDFVEKKYISLIEVDGRSIDVYFWFNGGLSVYFLWLSIDSLIDSSDSHGCFAFRHPAFLAVVPFQTRYKMRFQNEKNPACSFPARLCCYSLPRWEWFN